MGTVRIEKCPDCGTYIGEGMLYEHQRRHCPRRILFPDGQNAVVPPPPPAGTPTNCENTDSPCCADSTGQFCMTCGRRMSTPVAPPAGARPQAETSAIGLSIDMLDADRLLKWAEIADRVVVLLFVNGFGEHADRLVMKKSKQEHGDLGGWSRDAVKTVILEVLRQEVR